jgi:hypothetical protein
MYSKKPWIDSGGFWLILLIFVALDELFFEGLLFSGSPTVSLYFPLVSLQFPSSFPWFPYNFPVFPFSFPAVSL